MSGGVVSSLGKGLTSASIAMLLEGRGIKVALLTTVAGLIVAIILQIAYNFITSKVDAIVNKMEDASISLIDMLVKNNVIKG